MDDDWLTCGTRMPRLRSEFRQVKPEAVMDLAKL